MRQFKFKEWVFKNLFPYYYQENDTYHDSSGKGILQRFIEVCSQYLDDDIIADNGTQPGLDNIVNLIDVDLTPELFLNYLWEFLGEIPYAYGLIVQGKTYDKNNLRDWLFNNTDFPQADPRKLLKYALSLYKIRGTEQFYTILGRFYGFGIELVETTNGGNVGDDNLTPSHDHLVLACYEDNDELTIATYSLSSDEVRAPYPDGDCYSCLYFLVKLRMSVERYNQLLSSGRLSEVLSSLVDIIAKYLPIHCRIANYDNGDPKIIIRVSGDFNNDFNNDFGNQDEPV